MMQNANVTVGRGDTIGKLFTAHKTGMFVDRARRMALFFTLLVPLGLLHAWVLAEICIGIVDVLFLAEMVRAKNLAWARQTWFVLAMVWWVWLLFCSLPLPNFGGAGWMLGFVQAVVIIRLLVFSAALQTWLLTTVRARRAAWLMLVLSCLWIGVESWQQYLTGTDIFGNHRWGDGALTGPFWRPRAGQLYSHLLYIALLPPVLLMFARPSRVWFGLGAALTILGVATSVLIGQRMGFCLTGLGLVTSALFIRKLRPLAAAVAVIAALVILATPIISPPTYAKLVLETKHNMSHFWLSPYGELFTRATVMGLQSPLHGWGYNGFRVLCPEPRFNPGLPALDLAPTQLGLGACNQHPQNYYFQAFADAGFPGLVLFCIMTVSWMVYLGKDLIGQPDPLRLGLFIGVLSYTWPLASTDAFPTLYMLGWMFFFLGFGFACTDARVRN
jgi:hypothetical protein